jgi:2-amino-4-hydroxy-6-hydroxymethyldihydropteridine diphosphokinase
LARAYLSLGSNVAEATEQLDDAERRIKALPGVSVVARSTDRLAPAGMMQRRYRYRIIGIETADKPRTLLELMIGVEAAMKRDHSDVWGPRLIDIDLVAYDDIEIRSPRLHLPHPFAHSRPYVLEPLREIAPDVATFVERLGNRPR